MTDIFYSCSKNKEKPFWDVIWDMGDVDFFDMSIIVWLKTLCCTGTLPNVNYHKKINIFSPRITRAANLYFIINENHILHDQA